MTLTSPDERIVCTECMKSVTDMELSNLFSDERAASDISSSLVSEGLLWARVISCVITALIVFPSCKGTEVVLVFLGLSTNPTNMINAWARLFSIVAREIEWSPSLQDLPSIYINQKKKPWHTECTPWKSVELNSSQYYVLSVAELH